MSAKKYIIVRKESEGNVLTFWTHGEEYVSGLEVIALPKRKAQQCIKTAQKCNPHTEYGLIEVIEQ